MGMYMHMDVYAIYLDVIPVEYIKQLHSIGLFEPRETSDGCGRVSDALFVFLIFAGWSSYRLFRMFRPKTTYYVASSGSFSCQ
jgi:hypothetical protein